MPKILCVIPSRIGSTRLARKPLALLAGKPMVQRTYEAACRCKYFSDVIVATDSDEIAAVIHGCNGKIMMTDSQIETGSDRVAFVAQEFPDVDVVVNLQGDEPFVTEKMLNALVQPYLDGEKPVMATLANPLDFEKQFNTPAFVKVIVDQNKNAIYFSRSPIPFFRDPEIKAPVYHHQGIYAYTREFLLKFSQLPQTPLERTEKLEQLRALENGYKIRICITDQKTLEINTPEELEEAQKIALSYWN